MMKASSQEMSLTTVDSLKNDFDGIKIKQTVMNDILLFKNSVII